MSVSVLIPFTSTDRWRDKALVHVLNHYRTLRWDVRLGTVNGVWCKARAVADAAKHATGDVFVVADADCICDQTRQAVEAVNAGAPWATPHDWVHRLTQAATVELYAAEPALRTEERHQGVRGGGIVAVHRDLWENVPLDPRFIGWGHEDHSWGLALDCLAGPAWRGAAVLTHLWHPTPERATRRIGSEHGRQLERRYWQARNDPTAMRQLIDEAKEALWTPPT